MGEKFNKSDLKNLSLGQQLKIDNEIYEVYKFISYEEKYYKSKFTEFELVPKNRMRQTLWLSVGISEDYVELYEDIKSIRESDLKRKGYELTEDIIARVSMVADLDNGKYCDIEIYEEVKFREYEKYDELISVEVWDDDGIEEVIYSRSIDFGYIEVLKSHVDYIPMEKEEKRFGMGCVSLIALGIMIMFFVYKSPLFKATTLNKYLSESSDYTYYTSLTSDDKYKLKADVYTTFLSIDQASVDIIENSNADITHVQDSDDLYTVAMLTDDEYLVIYMGLYHQTYIQVSPREYTYVSNNDLYEYEYESSNEYYKDFYYSFGYLKDEESSSHTSSHYNHYVGGTVISNYNNKYYDLNSSIKRQSTFTRPSSSGGISSGK